MNSLLTNESKEEPNIVFTTKSQRTSQHGTKNVKTCNLTTLNNKNQTLNWISAFLSNRTQTVVLDGESSDIAPVTSGVPQGTVLGPVLFLVYINDLPEYLESSQLGLFADDSIIYKTIKSQKDCDSLKEDFDADTRWESDWLMAFHPDKCSVLRDRPFNLKGGLWFFSKKIF